MSSKGPIAPRTSHWEGRPSLEGLVQCVKSHSLFESFKSWSRSDVLSSFNVGQSCCVREIHRLGGPNPQGSMVREEFDHQALEDCDILFVSGVINEQVAPYIKECYEKMLRPRYVVAIGTCAASGALFDTIAVDQLFEVDIYVSGCPPTIESLTQAIELLRKRVKKKASRDYLQGVTGGA